MSDRRMEGPINGKVGYTLAVVKQVTPLLGWVAFLFMLFGFKISPPGQQIVDLVSRLAIVDERTQKLESLIEGLVRLRCVETTTRDAALIGLPCGRVQ